MTRPRPPGIDAIVRRWWRSVRPDRADLRADRDAPVRLSPATDVLGESTAAAYDAGTTWLVAANPNREVP